MTHDYSSPLDKGARFTSGFMTRTRPNHSGTDWASKTPGKKVPVYTVSDGVIEDTGNTAGLPGHTGKFVLIDHGKRTDKFGTDHMESYYGHLDSISVKPGQKVVAGQKIGVMGMTGNATGVHLHLTIVCNGRFIDPLVWLRNKGVNVGKDAPVKVVAKKFYTVKKGDTLSGIASKHKTSVANLMKLNSQIKDADKISIGDKVRIK